MRISAGDAAADTNLLLRFTELEHPLNSVATRAIHRFRRRGATVFVCPQNFIEFWAVATRPLVANGLGLSTVEAEAELASLERLFPMLPDDARIYPEWRRLVTQAGVSGKPTHDARLMAVAIVYGVDNLLTFNGGDFTRFGSLAPTVTILDPHTV
jgi:predicted nucleic acid-binding protein